MELERPAATSAAAQAQAAVSALYVYPVKSCRGIAVQAAEVTQRGFAHDRRWMIVDENGVFITQRQVTELCLVETALEQAEHGADRAERGVLRLSAPGQGSVLLPLEYEHGEERSVRVWRHDGLGVRHAEGSAWISQVLEREGSLVYMAERHERPVDPEYGRSEDRVSFADGFPFLVISEASLADLNQRLASPIGMLQFRPSIVVSGVPAYAEDHFARMRFGDLHFRGPKPCSRCVVTTIDPATATRHKEPLYTLARYRNSDGNVLFGMNLIPDSVGTLRVGDEVHDERGEQHG
jgi:uncharacterized protein YcbX